MMKGLKEFLANKSAEPRAKGRYEMIDVIRAFAVLLMIIFHLGYDLNAFGFAKIDFSNDLFWWTFPRVIVFLFLTAMGLSLELGPEKLSVSKILQRFFKIGGAAIVISITTFFMFRQNWIYFGTLHCIAVCSVLALPFRGRPKLAFLIALILLIPLAFGFHWPFFKLPHPSMDYIPALPWIGVVFLGMCSFHLGLHEVSIPNFPFKRAFFVLSKYSLFIYLIHQPILFGLTYLAKLAQRAFFP